MKIEIDVECVDGFEYTGEYKHAYCGDFYITADEVDEVRECVAVKGTTMKYLILRKTAPLTLLDRIKADFEDYNVIELGFDKPCADGLRMLCSLGSESHLSHVIYQSMKGFYRYVYECVDGGLFLDADPTWYSALGSGVTIHPVAVLFYKGN